MISGAPAMWNEGYTGDGVDVALIDSGVTAVDGLDAPGKIVNGPDFSGDGDPNDGFGHQIRLPGSAPSIADMSSLCPAWGEPQPRDSNRGRQPPASAAPPRGRGQIGGIAWDTTLGEHTDCRRLAPKALALKEKLGAPGRTRTSNPQIRSLVLYPIELRVPTAGGGV